MRKSAKERKGREDERREWEGRMREERGERGEGGNMSGCKRERGEG